jgi:hypothetical protein
VAAAGSVVAVSILSTGTYCWLGAHTFVAGEACQVLLDAMLSCDDVTHDGCAGPKVGFAAGGKHVDIEEPRIGSPVSFPFPLPLLIPFGSRGMKIRRSACEILLL